MGGSTDFNLLELQRDIGDAHPAARRHRCRHDAVSRCPRLALQARAELRVVGDVCPHAQAGDGFHARRCCKVGAERLGVKPARRTLHERLEDLARDIE